MIKNQFFGNRTSPKSHQIFWHFWAKILSPKSFENRQNGDKLPHLVTMPSTVEASQGREQA